MKIRTDYITNSSSSSFILAQVKSKKFLELFGNFDEFKEQLEENSVGYRINEDEHTFIIEYQDLEYEFGMGDYSVINILAALFDQEFANDGFRYEGDGRHEEYDEYECFTPLEEYAETTRIILEHKKELEEDIESIKISNNVYGWGGDSDRRFDMDWLEGEERERIFKEIAEENGCEVEEIDEEVYCNYVACMTDVSEQTISYDGKTKKWTETICNSLE